ncbi:MAG TPA: hypothetical protein PKD16_19475, partial [Saprospiraceae bacterium]|nr:hypothetical protein [Saprospiraceae bacterium]
SQKQEIIYLLDFDYPEYNDRLICAAIYTFSEPAVTGNNKTVTNEEYKNYTALPPANPLLLETEIQLGLARIITKQANLEGSFDSMRIGTPKKLENEEVYDIVDQLSLPNIAEAQLFVAKNEKGTRGVVINIDPAITSYYISAAKGMTKDPVINKEIATVTTEKSNNGGTKYIYKSLINDYKLFLIIDYPDSKKKDDLLFFSVY